MQKYYTYEHAGYANGKLRRDYIHVQRNTTELSQLCHSETASQLTSQKKKEQQTKQI